MVGDYDSRLPGVTNLTAQKVRLLHSRMSPLIEEQPGFGKTFLKGAMGKLAAIAGMLVLLAVLFFYFDSVGASMYYSGHAEQALGPTERALFVQKLMYGDDNPEVVNTKRNLARVYDSLGRVDDAEVLYKEALAWFKKYEQQNGAPHPYYAGTICCYGDHFAQQNKYDEAMRCFRETLTLVEKSHGTTNQEYAWTWQRIANLNRKMHREAEARDADARARAASQGVSSDGENATPSNGGSPLKNQRTAKQ
ncbi:MAG TPA: tetratricopeptide repeat protein [Candidatus Obscuribacterales bacterium]